MQKDKKKLKSYLGHIKQGPAYYKSPEQLNTIENVKSLYESREKIVQLFNNYAKNRSKNSYKSKQGTGLKIFTPKQMLQRLPIALAKIKSGNNSESLLNEIRQIVYLCINQKKLLKKYITREELRRTRRTRN